MIVNNVTFEAGNSKVLDGIKGSSQYAELCKANYTDDPLGWLWN